MNQSNIAFFDFDGTLYSGDSFTRFIFYSLKRRHIVRRGIKVLPWILAYYFKIYPAHKMRAKLFYAMFHGVSYAALDAISKNYAQQLRQRLNPELIQRFKWHQQQGDRVVIVSAAASIYLHYVAEHLNCDLICTDIEIHSILTGCYARPDCSSAEKVHRILKQFHLADFQSIYAYGNSHEDHAMLALATHAFWVNSKGQISNFKN